jgi:hypothetical protein
LHPHHWTHKAQVQIGLLNLTDNIKRVAFLIRKKHWNFDRVIAVYSKLK